MNTNEKSRLDKNIKKNEDILKQLGNAKCSWPTCGKKQMMSVSLPLMKRREDNSLEHVGADKGLKSGLGVPVPMCEFHVHFAPLCYMIQNKDDPTQANLMAPVDVVEVSKITIAALVFTGEFDQLIKAKKEAEEKNKEFLKDIEKKR